MMSAADWVEARIKTELTPFQRTAVEVLCAGLGSPWNIRTKWTKADWNCGRGCAFTILTGELATYDFVHLTQLVLAAHDRCVRVAIAPKAFRYLTIYIHPRQRDGDSIGSRHPTIEQAIETFRRHHPDSTGGDMNVDVPAVLRGGAAEMIAIIGDTDRLHGDRDVAKILVDNDLPLRELLAFAVTKVAGELT